ncbi:MAG TPA: PecA family PE domain-processing aspartic protease [Mycobacterium sp.]|nr:PecA family PE domain-processing aspartic protease [Mycobacterium sp.]
MAGHDRKKQARSANVGRRLLVGMGASAGVFLAAAAMATGATVTAAPAKADFEELLDPIIQPLLTSLTDSIGAFDPAAALDLTSWTDSFLASLNSIDLALPSAAEPAAAAASSTADTAALTGGTIPLTVLEGTEPAVNASIDGGDPVSLLVDTGSSGLVVPYTDLGDNIFTQLEALFQLGSPETFGISGYSGGVEYVYGVYNTVPVDYLNDAGGTALTTNGPVDVELFSWSNNLSDPFENFQSFLSANQVDGILGIGENTAGPTTTPFEDYGGVLVDIPNHQLVIGEANPFPEAPSTAGTGVSDVFEQIGTGAKQEVTNIIDSGGVFGTISSNLETGSSVPAGTEITVYNTAGQELYSYSTIGNFDVDGPKLVSDAPTIVSGTSIDSGVLPFLNHAVYIDYAGDKTYFGPLTT